jgi:outer membrane receptor protein involved in Fe transport
MRHLCTSTLLILVLAVGMTRAQETATISGTVTDVSKAVAAGVTVTMTHLATNVNYTAVTNSSGFYTNSTLPVGSYRITAEAPGFKKAERTGLTLEVGDHAVVDFVLEVGQVNETVEVQAQAAQIDTSDATLGNAIENQRIDELPMNGRSGLSLVELTPGVRSQATTQSGFADRGSDISSFTINGGLTNSNMIVVDGLINIGTRWGDTNVNMSSDAIQEFKVESGVVSVEYNYFTGGVVNFVTKSGTNSVHGILYEFLRNNDLDARNFFSGTIPPYRYNQYGGSIGGPILKNKLFYFGNVEEWKFDNSFPLISTTPTVAWRNGDLSHLLTGSGALIPVYDPHSTIPNPSATGYVRTPFPGNIIPPSELDPVIQKVMSFYPMPNAAPTNAFTQANNFDANLPAISSNLQELIRVDYVLSAKDTISTRYILTANRTDNASQAMTSQAAYFPNRNFDVRNDVYNQRNAEVTETHIFSPSIFNQVLLGVVHSGLYTGLPSLGAGFAQSVLGLPADWPSLAYPLFLPSDAQGIEGWSGSVSYDSGRYSQTTEQVSDKLLWTKGKHLFRFGVQFLFNYLGPNLCNTCSGETTFNQVLTENPQSPSGTGSGLASELLGAVASSTTYINLGASYVSLDQGYYFQDDWKVAPRLTLTLGLRWDYQQIPGERHNGISNFNPNVIDPVNGLRGELQFAGPAPGFGRAPILPDYRNWSPRVGLAWDIFGDHKTVIRAGYGIYYYYETLLADLFGGLGYKNNASTYSAPGGNTQFPAFYLQNGYPTPPQQPIGNALGPAGFLGSTVTWDEPWGRTPYVQQRSFSVQRQLPGGVLAQWAYSANQGTHLRSGSFALTQLNPQYLALGNALENSVPNPYYGIIPASSSLGGPTITLEQSLQPFPYYAGITVQNSHQGSSTYESFIMTVEKRYSSGFVILGSYTNSKGIADGPYDQGGNFSTGYASLAYQEGLYDLARERAIVPWDTPQRLAISYIYELPFGAGKHWHPSNSVAKTLVSGWQLNSVMAFEGGLPLEVSGANNNLATRPNSTGESAKLSNPTINEWFNTQDFVNPPAWTFGNVGALPNVRAPGDSNVDFSVTKLTQFGERWRLQLRGESFNVLNHTNFMPPNTTFVPGANGLNSSSTFGTITASRSARIFQVGARLIF